MTNLSQVEGRRLGCFRHNVAARCVSDWGFAPQAPGQLTGSQKLILATGVRGSLFFGFTNIGPSLPTKKWSGSRSSIVYAVSMVSRVRIICFTHRFHHDQSGMLCRYRIDAGFRPLRRLIRKGCGLYCHLVVHRQMGSPILGASPRGCD